MYSCSRAVFAYSFTGLRIRFAAAHQAAQRDRLIAFRKHAYGQCHGQQTVDEHLCGNLKSRSVIVPVIEQTEEADSDGKYMRYEDYIKNRIVTNPFKDTEILKVTVNANTPEGPRKPTT